MSGSRPQRCRPSYPHYPQPGSGVCVRYKLWRSNKDKEMHLLCAEGSEAFNALPTAIRHLGLWTGGAEGDVSRLRLPYRVQLAEQGFVVIYEHVAQLQLDMKAAATNLDFEKAAAIRDTIKRLRNPELSAA